MDYINHYDAFYNEAAFLSVYVAMKLKRGGEPETTKEELENVLKEYSENWHCSKDDCNKIKKFDFSNLKKLAENFQVYASEDRSNLRPCFVLKDDKLIPTYHFYNFMNDSASSIANYLSEAEFSKLKTIKIIESGKSCDNEIRDVASLASKYLTARIAKAYINSEVERGRWPKHLTDVSYALNKNLGEALELEGTKEYFDNFYNTSVNYISELLKQGNGVLNLSNDKFCALANNNLVKLLKLFPTIEHFPNCAELSFQMKIENGAAIVKEKELISFDPYGDWSDDYKFRDINLKEEFKEKTKGKLK